MPDTKQIQKIREAIVNQGDEFNKVVNDEDFKSKFGEIIGEKNKRIQKEFREAQTPKKIEQARLKIQEINNLIAQKKKQLIK